jgi:hypothetical protein
MILKNSLSRFCGGGILVAKLSNHPIERIGFSGVAIIARDEFKDRRLQSWNTDLGIGQVMRIDDLGHVFSVSIRRRNGTARLGRQSRSSTRRPSSGSAANSLGIPRRVRPTQEPYDLRRRSYSCGEFVEIRVGADDDEVICPGEFPDLAIWACEQAELPTMGRPRVQLSEADDEFAREILVQQQLHKSTRLPMRAANSYTAGKSSGSGSG